MVTVAREAHTHRRAGQIFSLPGCLALTFFIGPMLVVGLTSPDVSGRLIALGLTIYTAASFLALTFAKGLLSRDIDPRLRLPGAFCILALVFLTLAASRFAPGGVNPLWQPVGAGAGVLDIEAALVGALTLIGLCLGVIVAVAAATDRKTAPRLFSNLPFVLLAPAAVIVVRLSGGGAGPARSLLALCLGASLILAAGQAARSLRANSAALADGRFGVRESALYFAAAAGCFSGLVWASPKGAVLAVVTLAVLAGWEALSSGGAGRLRRGPLLFVLTLGAGVAVAGGVLVLSWLGDPPGAEACREAHMAAFLASPWVGYGPGSGEAIASLSMTRANIDALLDPACPRSAYVSALEQGGVLMVAPLVLALIALGWTGVSGSMRSKGMSSSIRSLVCGAGFCALFGIVDAAPGTLGGLPISLTLLGFALGAAGAGR